MSRVVYVVRNMAGIALYVGVTGDLERRMHGHKAVSPWWSPDLLVTSAPETRNLEAITIDRLRPVYNIINWDIWVERSGDLWELTMQGYSRQEIQGLTGVPGETLTRVLWPYWQEARRLHGGVVRQERLRSIWVKREALRRENARVERLLARGQAVTPAPDA